MIRYSPYVVSLYKNIRRKARRGIMKHCIKNKEQHSVQLREDSVKASGYKIFYSLYRTSCSGITLYRIKASCGEESRVCSFGSDMFAAYKIYRKIVRNNVTPCTLGDIAEDYAKLRRY